jgi:PAS domain S-box-containing protein
MTPPPPSAPSQPTDGSPGPAGWTSSVQVDELASRLRRFFMSPWLAWLFLGFGLAVTFLVWQINHNHQEEDVRRSFDATKFHIESALANEIESFEMILESAQGLFNSSASMNHTEWHRFFQSLKLEQRHSVIHTLGYVVYVPEQKLKAFEAAARAEGAPRFTVWPKGNRPFYAILKYIESPTIPVTAEGFDVATNPEEWEAMERARDTGQPSASKRTFLSDDPSKTSPSIVMFLPIYRRGAPPATVEERRTALEGWVGLTVRIDDLMKKLLPYQLSSLDFELFDGPTPSKVSLLYDSAPPLCTVGSPYEPVFSAISNITVGERIWTLSFLARPDSYSTYNHWPLWMLPGSGLLMSGILFFVILGLSHFLRQASRQASKTAAELRLRNRTLEAVTNGIVITNPSRADNPVIYVNPAFERMTGYTAQEMLGRNCRFLQGPDKQQTALEEVRRAIREERDCRVILRNYRKNGSLFWNQLSISPVRDEKGQRTYYVGILADITERRLVEEALGEERSLLRTLIDNLPVSIYVKDTESRYIISNLSHVRLLGATMTDDVVGQSDFDFFPKDLAARYFNDEQTLMRLGQAMVDKEELITDKAGKKRWFLTTKLPIKDSGGHIIGLVGLSRDITERRHAIEALAEERNLLRSLIDDASDFIYAKDLHGRFIIANKALSHLLGAKSPTEVVGKTDFEYFPHDEAERDSNHERQVMHSGKPYYDIERQRMDTSGKTISYQTVLWPLRDSRGKVAGVVGIDRDVTARVKAESDRDLLAVAVQHASESVVITDQDGIVQYVNASFELISGFSRAQVSRKHLDSVQGQKIDEPARQQMWQLLREGRTWKGPIVSLDSTGKEYVEEASISPMHDSQGNIIHFVAVKRDITRERQLEEQFRQAQKMEAVGQLAGGIAHDFNNTIGVILGYSELILRKMEKSDPTATKIEAMRTAAQKASQIIRQLLAFSRRQFLQPRVLNLNTHVKQMKDMIQRLVGENIKLTVLGEAIEAQTKVDPNYLDQVIMNMAVNARDAMTNGGEFTLKTSSLKLDTEHAAQYPGLSPGLYVLLEISDTGVGMSPDVCAHIFEPFFTTKGRGKGTGLGLSTAYGIIKQSGGHIAFKTQLGKGTTFRIYLPCSDDSIERITQAKGDVRVPHGTETILVVEDEKGVLDMVSELLDGLGYKIIKANNPAEALVHHENHRGVINLLFTDIVMPGMSGIDLAKKFQTLRPDMRLLFTSGYAGRATSEEGVIDLSFNFLAKPYDLATLAFKVREVLDSSHLPKKRSRR